MLHLDSATFLRSYLTLCTCLPVGDIEPAPTVDGNDVTVTVQQPINGKRKVSSSYRDPITSVPYSEIIVNCFIRRRLVRRTG